MYLRYLRMFSKISGNGFPTAPNTYKPNRKKGIK